MSNLSFGGGTAAFHGDYNEFDAIWTGANHIVHVAWADDRDVSPCDLDPTPEPASNNTGNPNESVYADTLIIALKAGNIAMLTSPSSHFS